jgi:hypothetical protein
MIPQTANQQNCLIDIKTGEEFIFPFGVSIQRGKTVSTRATRRIDSTRRCQDLVRRLGVQAQTISVSFVLNRLDVDINTIPQIESLVGREFELYFNQFLYGEFCVIESTFALTLDGVSGLTALSVTLSLTERFVKPAQPPKIDISVLHRGNEYDFV